MGKKVELLENHMTSRAISCLNAFDRGTLAVKIYLSAINSLKPADASRRYYLPEPLDK